MFKQIIPTGGGGRLYSSWVISTSLFQEIMSASAAPAPAPPSGHPQVRPPCLMLPTERDKSTGHMVYSFFNPINNKIFKIQNKTHSSLLPNKARCFWSSHGWLAFVDPSDAGLYLWDPFSDAVIRLPSMESFPVVLGTIRKSYNNRSFTKFIIQGGSGRVPFSPRFVSKLFLDKLVPLSPFVNNNNDCLFMAVGDSFRKLLFCKPGDTAWTPLSGPLHPYRCIMPSSIKDKVFYAVSSNREIEAWDLSDLSCIKRTLIDYKLSLCKPKFCELEADFRASPIHYRKSYLVETSGDLLYVLRYVDVKSVPPDKIPHKTLGFDVYKMDFSLGVWTYVNSLGDRALFVGLSDPFSLHVCDYPGLRPNSIYFADDCLDNCVKEYLYGGHDMGVYNLEDNSIELFYPFGNLKKIMPAPFWVAPNPQSDNVAEWFA